jgi:hypothetical protein
VGTKPTGPGRTDRAARNAGSVVTTFMAIS